MILPLLILLKTNFNLGVIFSLNFGFSSLHSWCTKIIFAFRNQIVQIQRYWIRANYCCLRFGFYSKIPSLTSFRCVHLENNKNKNNLQKILFENNRNVKKKNIFCNALRDSVIPHFWLNVSPNNDVSITKPFCCQCFLDWHKKEVFQTSVIFFSIITILWKLKW